ncbi:MAG: hypothetical protein OEZ13_10090 [Spirochaetia bacterium]|nr:hypothetical protein [Spirochaetia bacterium]
MSHLTEHELMTLLQESERKNIFANSKVKDRLEHIENCPVCFADFWESYTDLDFLKNEKVSFLAKFSIKLASIKSAFTVFDAEAFLPLTVSPMAAVRDASAEDNSEGLYSQAEAWFISRVFKGSILKLLIIRKLGSVYFRWKIKEKTDGVISFFINQKLEERQNFMGDDIEFMLDAENLKKNEIKTVSFTAETSEKSLIEDLVEVRVS